jgi:hypothetical protein
VGRQFRSGGRSFTAIDTEAGETVESAGNQGYLLAMKTKVTVLPALFFIVSLSPLPAFADELIKFKSG